MERKVNSSQFAFVGNAVGAEGTVCPRPDRRFAKDAVRPLINSKAPILRILRIGAFCVLFVYFLHVVGLRWLPL